MKNTIKILLQAITDNNSFKALSLMKQLGLDNLTKKITCIDMAKVEIFAHFSDASKRKIGLNTLNIIGYGNKPSFIKKYIRECSEINPIIFSHLLFGSCIAGTTKSTQILLKEIIKRKIKIIKVHFDFLIQTSIKVGSTETLELISEASLHRFHLNKSLASACNQNNLKQAKELYNRVVNGDHFGGPGIILRNELTGENLFTHQGAQVLEDISKRSFESIEYNLDFFKKVGHIFDIPHIQVNERNKLYGYGSSSNQQNLYWISHYLKNFKDQKKSTLDKKIIEDLNTLIKSFEFAKEHYSSQDFPQKCIDRYKADQLVVLPISYFYHHVGLAVFKNQIIYTNNYIKEIFNFLEPLDVETVSKLCALIKTEYNRSHLEELIEKIRNKAKTTHFGDPDREQTADNCGYFNRINLMQGFLHLKGHCEKKIFDQYTLTTYQQLIDELLLEIKKDPFHKTFIALNVLKMLHHSEKYSSEIEPMIISLYNGVIKTLSQGHIKNLEKQHQALLLNIEKRLGDKPTTSSLKPIKSLLTFKDEIKEQADKQNPCLSPGKKFKT